MRRSIAARGARPLAAAATASSLACLLTAGAAPALAATRVAPAGQDPLVQPFSATSPWNTPVGDRARYTAAGLGDGPVGIESVLVAPAPGGAAASRLARLVRQACAAPSAGWVVLVDAPTQVATSYRCRGGAAGVGSAVPLTGTGMPSPGAASLPAPGGAVSAAELAGERPLRHALAVSVPGTLLAPGMLLALPPRLASGVRPRTPTGRRLLAALRTYGAYVAVTRTTAVRIRVRTDLPPGGDGVVPELDASTRADIATMVSDLAVVTNAGPSTARPVPAPAPSRSASSTVTSASPPPTPVVVAARPVVQLTPGRAPAGVLWGLAGLACALLAVGLGAGRRLARGR